MTKRPALPSAWWAPSLAVVVSLTCSALGQEPAPDLPPVPPAPPDESAMLPENAGKMPNPDGMMLPDEKLPIIPPPGALPIREWGAGEGGDDGEANDVETPGLDPITEAPAADPLEKSYDLSREVAMNSALSTGDTLLGSLGGLGGVLSSPFLAGAPLAPLASSGPVLQPIRLGSLDVKAHAAAGLNVTHIGGDLYDDDTSVSGLFLGGFSALYGRNQLSTLWFSYDVAGNYPENAAQGRQAGSEGGSGGFDHNVSVIGSVTFPELRKVKFVFGAKYARLSGIDRDTGENSKRQIATALFITDYQYSKKTAFSLNVSVPVRQFTDGVSSNGITSSLFADTAVTQKTTVGLGYTFGSLDMEDGEDQIFQQALLRVTYAPTRFLLFDATTGVDFRDHGGSSSATPIFGLSTTWDSRHGTLVTLAAERRIFNAASAVNTNFTSTSVVLSAYQRIGRAVIGQFSAGYEHTEYDGFGTGSAGGRTDNLSYLSAGITVPITLHWSCSLSGSAGKNESDTSGFDFWQMMFKSSLTF